MKKHAEQESQHDAATVSTPSGANSGTATAPDTAGTAASGAEMREKGDESTSSAGESRGDGQNASSAAAETAGLVARVAELERLNAELQDQYLRKAADFDNYRKRMIREKQDAIDYANASLLTDLVQILDDFDRAIDSGGTHEEGSSAHALASGVGMIRSQLGSMLENKYSLTYYPAKGAAFDPNFHEAVATTPSPDVTEATVAEEYVKGYKLRDRILRHSKVMVHTPAANGQ